MRVTLILPAIGKKPGQRYIKTWKMEPLTIATIKAALPEDVECVFFDDRLELIDYDQKTDLVGITVETYTARRAYAIAAEFKKRGVPVVLGGYHPTLVPEEAEQYADAIVIGNSETVWGKIIADAEKGQLQRRYISENNFSDKLPERKIYADKKYLPLSLIETGRGCPFKCEFCSISSFYCSKYKNRDIRQVINDLESTKHRYKFLVDDNIVANPAYVKKLFTEIIPLKIKWTSQGTLTMARDRELLKLMKKSGCDTVLIGFESLDEANLKQMNKGWSLSLGEMDELVRTIHGEGISIYATFVFGFDHDTKDSFQRALEFSRKHGFFFTAFNHLLPFPGTPLYQRLKEEGRLLKDQWWLDENYQYGDISYQPKNFSPQELSELCVQSRRAFYRPLSIINRWFKLCCRNLDPFTGAIFLSQNIKLGIEVDEKMRIPLGSGLDELPK